MEYLGFREKISTGIKKAVQILVETYKKYLRSVTGSNFRNIILLVGKSSVDDVTKDDADKIEGLRENWQECQTNQKINTKQLKKKKKAFAEARKSLSFIHIYFSLNCDCT